MDEFRMSETSSVDHRETSHDIEARDQIPRPLCIGIKFPTPGKVEAVKCPGYARGGMLKLRFEWYIKQAKAKIKRVHEVRHCFTGLLLTVLWRRQSRADHPEGKVNDL